MQNFYVNTKIIRGPLFVQLYWLKSTYNTGAAAVSLQLIKLDFEFNPTSVPNDAQILAGPAFPIVSGFYFYFSLWNSPESASSF